jgi:hypothetical protein
LGNLSSSFREKYLDFIVVEDIIFPRLNDSTSKHLLKSNVSLDDQKQNIISFKIIRHTSFYNEINTLRIFIENALFQCKCDE